MMPSTTSPAAHDLLSPDPAAMRPPRGTQTTKHARAGLGQRGWLRGALGVGLGLIGAAGVLYYWGPRHGTTAPAPPSAVQADRAGVTLLPDAPQWRYVELATAEEGPPLAALPAPGRIDFDPKRTSSVGAPLAGRVETVAVRIGDRIKAGDPLFSVRSGALADLDREVQAARETVGVKRRLLERTRDLLAVQAVPEKELLAVAAELKEAELSLKAGARSGWVCR